MWMQFKVMSVCSCAYSVAHAAQELLAGVCGIRSHTWRTIWGGTGILACLWWSLPTELLTASIEARVVLGVGVALIVLGSVPWGAIDPRLQPPH